MCGVFGWSFASEDQLDSVSRAVLSSVLGKANEARGDHSWGILSLPDAPQADEPTYVINKDAGPITGVAGALQAGYYTLMGFGHTRHATHGAPTKENAHPFEIGNIIGSHNGVIYNHSELNKKYDRKFEVDSMHIFAHINEDKSLGELEGYGTAIWFDKRHPNRIYFSRLNGSGELSVIGLGKWTNEVDPAGVVFSSSMAHLRDALETSGITEYREFNIEPGRIYYTENGQCYKPEMTKFNIERTKTTNWQSYSLSPSTPATYSPSSTPARRRGGKISRGFRGTGMTEDDFKRAEKIFGTESFRALVEIWEGDE